MSTTIVLSSSDVSLDSSAIPYFVLLIAASENPPQWVLKGYFHVICLDVRTFFYGIDIFLVLEKSYNSFKWFLGPRKFVGLSLNMIIDGFPHRDIKLFNVNSIFTALEIMQTNIVTQHFTERASPNDEVFIRKSTPTLENGQYFKRRFDNTVCAPACSNLNCSYFSMSVDEIFRGNRFRYL